MYGGIINMDISIFGDINGTWIDASEEHITSFSRVEIQQNKKPAARYNTLLFKIMLTLMMDMWGVAFFSSEKVRVTTCIMRSLRRNPWCYWSVDDCDGMADCSWSRLTALLVGRLLGVFLFTGARSMVRVVQWSPMKSESELFRLGPTWVFAELLLSLVTLRLIESTTRIRELHCSNSTW
jgi:hypothetical protein